MKSDNFYTSSNKRSKAGGAMAALLVAATFLLKPGAADAAKEPPKFSGLVFGDFYYVSQHHNTSIEGMNGFWMRRIYFTYTQKLEENFSVVFRLEMNSPDGFDPAKDTTLNPYVKVASLKYSSGMSSVVLGLTGTPTWQSVEDILGYRPVEKTPLDLFKMGAAVDTGISISGYFSEDKRTSYTLMFGNGSSTKSEVDKGKTVYASLRHRLTPELLIEAYGDTWNRSGGKEDWTTLQGFLAYTGKRGKMGVLYASQKRTKKGTPDLTLTVTSFYADYRVSERVMPLFRVDFVSDPVPGGDTIPYFPLATTARPTFYLFGIRYDVTNFFYLVPNVEMVTYSEPTSGTAPDDDIFYRLTFYYNW